MLAVAAAAAGLVVALPAAAAVKVATYTGTVSDGEDTTGVFGLTPGTNLAGYSWVATTTYDRNLGGFPDTDGVNYDESSGGSDFGVGSPIIRATFTLNGVTKTIFGAYSGYVLTENDPYTYHYAEDYSDDSSFELNGLIELEARPAGAPISLDQNFGPVATTGLGYFEWSVYDYGLGDYTQEAYAELDGNLVYSVAAVPEPASWAMLIAGFGLVGAAARRHRAQVSVRA